VSLIGSVAQSLREEVRTNRAQLQGTLGVEADIMTGEVCDVCGRTVGLTKLPMKDGHVRAVGHPACGAGGLRVGFASLSHAR
jgi:hypothetical protein